jgi:DUF1680 family protein
LNIISSEITGGFWGDWQAVNAHQAIFHQWEQLEKTGCIDNFRILAEGKGVFRRGWFFADSDAYKWLEAAFRLLSNQYDPELASYVDEFIGLIEKSQSLDGYLYTFNQVHFPKTRWVNLQIEHELYCHGHLIEAFVSGAELEDYKDKLSIATKAADCIYSHFAGKGPKYTPGHEEIEIALLRLFELTTDQNYFDLARQFLEMRGKQALFGLNILRESASNTRRVNLVEEQHKRYFESKNTVSEDNLPPSNRAKKPNNIQIRWILNALSGNLLQQHKPVDKQTIPVGHAVRFAYLETAAAMVDRLTGQETYRTTLEKSWHHMVDKRMYVTGGIGSLPVIEGFGRDYELDPEYAYTETCAGLGSLFWDREMAQLIGEASYADLYEWQLYNAVLVGMGLDGKTYFYNNPLASRGGIERRNWYEVPCCPSNLSRTIAWLQKDVLTIRGDSIDISQYFSSKHLIEIENGEITIEIFSELPWDGKVQISVKNQIPKHLKLRLRQPTWAEKCKLTINGETINQINRFSEEILNPQFAKWIEVQRRLEADDQLTLDFSTPVVIYHPNENITSVRNKIALIRGPLVYCLENIDNPDIDIFQVAVDHNTLAAEFTEDLLGGIWIIKGYSLNSEPLTFIPYYMWGNRGASTMTVFIGMKEEV